MFYSKGTSNHRVDWQPLTISAGQLLFVQPNQIHVSPPMKGSIEFFTLSFDLDCLSLLPRQLPFLINPFNTSKITFDKAAGQRVIILFEMLNALLHAGDGTGNMEIIIAHLNSLLTEFNNGYFRNIRANHPDEAGISEFIRFKLQVESDFKNQPSILSMAEKLSISENKLYKLVKTFSGLSPKEFLIHRVILEAQRILFYDKSSAKALAYELGFSDPDYFSRLFKKQTGRTVRQFLMDVQD
jgi:AraC family transcriptional activator of pobA